MTDLGLFSNAWAITTYPPRRQKVRDPRKKKKARKERPILFQNDTGKEVEMVIKTKHRDSKRLPDEEERLKNQAEEEISFQFDSDQNESLSFESSFLGSKSFQQSTAKRSMNEETLALLLSEDSNFSRYSRGRSQSFSSCEIRSSFSDKNNGGWFNYVAMSASGSSIEDIPQEITSKNRHASTATPTTPTPVLVLVPSDASADSGYTGESETDKTFDTGVVDKSSNDSIKINYRITTEAIYSGAWCPVDFSAIQTKTSLPTSFGQLLSSSPWGATMKLQQPSALISSSESLCHTETSTVEEIVSLARLESETNTPKEDVNPNDHVPSSDLLAIEDTIRDVPFVKSSPTALQVTDNREAEHLEIDLSKSASKEISPLSDPEIVEIEDHKSKKRDEIPSIPTHTGNPGQCENDKSVALSFKHDLVLLCASMQQHVTKAHASVNSQEYHSCVTDIERESQTIETVRKTVSDGGTLSRNEMAVDDNRCINQRTLLRKKACMEELVECFQESTLDRQASALNKATKSNEDIWTSTVALSSLDANKSEEEMVFRSDTEPEQSDGDFRLEQQKHVELDPVLLSAPRQDTSSSHPSTSSMDKVEGQDRSEHPLERSYLYHTEARINKDICMTELRECCEEALREHQEWTGQYNSPPEESIGDTGDGGEVNLVLSWTYEENAQPPLSQSGSSVHSLDSDVLKAIEEYNASREENFDSQPLLSKSSSSMDSLDSDVLKAIQEYDAAKKEDRACITLRLSDELDKEIENVARLKKAECMAELSNCVSVTARKNKEACIAELRRLIQEMHLNPPRNAQQNRPTEGHDAFVEELLSWIDHTYFTSPRRKDNAGGCGIGVGGNCLCVTRFDERPAEPEHESCHFELLALLRQHSLQRRKSILLIQRTVRRFLSQKRYGRRMYRQAGSRKNRRKISMAEPSRHHRRNEPDASKPVSHEQQIRQKKDRCLDDMLTQIPFRLQAKERCRALKSSCLSAMLEQHFDTCLTRIRKDACMMELRGLIQEVDQVQDDGWMAGEECSFVDDLSSIMRA